MNSSATRLVFQRGGIFDPVFGRPGSSHQTALATVGPRRTPTQRAGRIDRLPALTVRQWQRRVPLPLENRLVTRKQGVHTPLLKRLTLTFKCAWTLGRIVAEQLNH